MVKLLQRLGKIGQERELDPNKEYQRVGASFLYNTGLPTVVLNGMRIASDKILGSRIACYKVPFPCAFPEGHRAVIELSLGVFISVPAANNSAIMNQLPLHCYRYGGVHEYFFAKEGYYYNVDEKEVDHIYDRNVVLRVVDTGQEKYPYRMEVRLDERKVRQDKDILVEWKSLVSSIYSKDEITRHQCELFASNPPVDRAEYNDWVRAYVAGSSSELCKIIDSNTKYQLSSVDAEKIVRDLEVEQPVEGRQYTSLFTGALAVMSDATTRDMDLAEMFGYTDVSVGFLALVVSSKITMQGPGIMMEPYMTVPYRINTQKIRMKRFLMEPPMTDEEMEEMFGEGWEELENEGELKEETDYGEFEPTPVFEAWFNSLKNAKKLLFLNLFTSFNMHLMWRGRDNMDLVKNISGKLNKLRRSDMEFDLGLVMENFVLADNWDFLCTSSWDLVLEGEFEMNEKEEDVFRNGAVTCGLTYQDEVFPEEIESEIRTRVYQEKFVEHSNILLEVQGSVCSLLYTRPDRLTQSIPSAESMLSIREDGSSFFDWHVDEVVALDWPGGVKNIDYWRMVTSTVKMKAYRWPEEQKVVVEKGYPLMALIRNDPEMNTSFGREKMDPFLQWELNVQGTEDRQLVSGLLEFRVVLEAVKSIKSLLRVAIPKTFRGHEALVATLGCLRTSGYLVKWVDDRLRWSDFLLFSIKRSKYARLKPLRNQEFYHQVLLYLYRYKIVSYELLIKSSFEMVKEEVEWKIGWARLFKVFDERVLAEKGEKDEPP